MPGIKTFVCCCLLTSILFVAATVSFGQQQKAKNPKKPKPPGITWVNKPTEKQLPLPPRVMHKTFRSKLVNQDVGYCVYLPVQYEIEPNRRFPVIYNLHGNGGNELTGMLSAEVLHEGIVAGRWPPMIMVFPNGGQSTFYKNSHDGKLPIESIFIKEFIPFIDKTYRTVAAKHGRCIEGFSMGGRGSTRLAVKYPELFCSLFCQAGNVPHLLETFDNAEPGSLDNSFLGPDRNAWLENDVYTLVEKNRERIVGKLRIQIACGTKDGGHLPTIRDFHQRLLDLKIDHTYIEIEGLKHERTKMINMYRPIWFDYHVESLKLAESENKKSK